MRNRLKINLAPLFKRCPFDFTIDEAKDTIFKTPICFVDLPPNQYI